MRTFIPIKAIYERRKTKFRMSLFTDFLVGFCTLTDFEIRTYTRILELNSLSVSRTLRPLLDQNSKITEILEKWQSYFFGEWPLRRLGIQVTSSTFFRILLMLWHFVNSSKYKYIFFKTSLFKQKTQCRRCYLYSELMT